MHIAVYKVPTEVTIPTLKKLRDNAYTVEFNTIVKIGCTHMDAHP
jgi:fumarate hydratase class II